MSRNSESHAESRNTEHVDVVVIGMGAAGCAAARTAHDAGATVVVLEKAAAAEAGGNTRVSGGGWFHHDDPDRAAVYLRALCGDRALPESVVQAWAHGSREVSAGWSRSVSKWSPRRLQLRRRGVSGIAGQRMLRRIALRRRNTRARTTVRRLREGVTRAGNRCTIRHSRDRLGDRLCHGRGDRCRHRSR